MIAVHLERLRPTLRLVTAAEQVSVHKENSYQHQDSLHSCLMPRKGVRM